MDKYYHIFIKKILYNNSNLFLQIFQKLKLTVIHVKPVQKALKLTRKYIFLKIVNITSKLNKNSVTMRIVKIPSYGNCKKEEKQLRNEDFECILIYMQLQ